MKLSAVLITAAAAAFPGASAEYVSLRGAPFKQALLEFANCDTKEDCPSYGVNSCETIEKDCDGQCFWNGNSCRYGNSPSPRNCRDYGNRNRCEDEDCDWVNGQCRNPTNNGLRCRDYDGTSRNRCENEGCSWNSNRGTCSLVCRDFDNDRSQCLISGYCEWNSGSCDLISCRDLDNTSASECENAGSCEWSSGRCRAASEEEEDVAEEVEEYVEEEVEDEESEELLEFANCDTKTDCPRYGVNSCETIDKDCDGQCFWDGSSCRRGSSSGGGNRSCRDYGNRNRCLDEDCDWVNGQCRNPTNDGLRCRDYDGTSRSRCEDEGCSWNSSRRTCALVCRDFDGNRSQCLISGYCEWNSGNCDLISCRDLDNTSRNECENAGSCLWSNGRCRVASEEEEDVAEEVEDEESEE